VVAQCLADRVDRERARFPGCGFEERVSDSVAEQEVEGFVERATSTDWMAGAMGSTRTSEKPAPVSSVWTRSGSLSENISGPPSSPVSDSVTWAAAARPGTRSHSLVTSGCQGGEGPGSRGLRALPVAAVAAEHRGGSCPGAVSRRSSR
jgi:hypothetical protein